MSKFVPDDFSAKEEFKTGKFVLKKLTPKFTKIDYEAVLRSAEHIRKSYNITDKDSWPQDYLTIEKDYSDLAQHEKEFDDKTAFAYTVLSLDEKVCLGCVYIDPTDSEDFDAMVTLWTDNEKDDLILYKAVKSIVNENFPFKRVAYPKFEVDLEFWKTQHDV